MAVKLTEPTFIIGEAVSGEAYKTRKQLEDAISNMHRNTFDIAELLHKVKISKYYMPEFSTFNEYLKDLDIKERKAQYLDRIVDVMEKVEIPRNDYEPLGINKLREITSLDPDATWTNPETKEELPMKSFISDFVEKGRGMELDEIKRHVRTLKGFVGEHDIVNRTFGWTKETFDSTIAPAIELAKRHLGSSGRDAEGMAIDPSDSRAIEVLAAEYLADPANNILEE